MGQEQCYPIGTIPLCNKPWANNPYDYVAKLNITLSRDTDADVVLFSPFSNPCNSMFKQKQQLPLDYSISADTKKMSPNHFKFGFFGFKGQVDIYIFDVTMKGYEA